MDTIRQQIEEKSIVLYAKQQELFAEEKLFNELIKEHILRNRKFEDGDIVNVFCAIKHELLGQAIVSSAGCGIHWDITSLHIASQSGYTDSDYQIYYRLKKVKNDGNASKHRHDIKSATYEIERGYNYIRKAD